MKKLLFILLLVSFAASGFSLDLSAELLGGFNLISGDSQSNDITMGGSGFGRANLEAQAETDKFGAWFRLRGGLSTTGLPGWVNAYGHLWFNPTDAFSFNITTNPDGHWALDGNAGSNFYGTAGDVLQFNGDNSQAPTLPNTVTLNPFFEGFERGAFISITPSESFAFNAGWHLFAQNDALDTLKETIAQVTFNLGESSVIGITYEGGTLTSAIGDSSTIYGYFGTTLGNIELDVGVSYTLPEKNVTRTDIGIGTLVLTQTINYPIMPGISINIPGDSFNFKARVFGVFGGSSKTVNEIEVGGNINPYLPSVTIDLPIIVSAEVLPSFKISDNFTFNIGAGFAFISWDYGAFDDPIPMFLYSVKPYVTVGLTDFAAFYAGAYFEGFTITEGKVMGVTNPGETVYAWGVNLGLRLVF